MSSRGKIMTQMAKKMLSKNDGLFENECVVTKTLVLGDVPLNNEPVAKQKYEPTANTISCFEWPLDGSVSGNKADPIQSRNTNIARSRQSSYTSTSSSDSLSNDDSSSSTEDCDDLLDETYKPEDDRERENVEEDMKTVNHNVQLNALFPSTSTIISTSINGIHTNQTSDSILGTPSQDIPIFTSPHKKGLKRKLQKDAWKRNVLKKLRNSGKAYESHTETKLIRNERKLKPSCGEKCRLQCSSKFSEDERQQLFSDYWNLCDIEKQRQFIANSMQIVQPKYRYVRIGGIRNQRLNNNAFYFCLNNQKIRVCKLFFRNTIDINDRPIRTVLQKSNKVANVLLEPDLRGKHGKQKSLDPSIRAGIKLHIESIPKIESNYTRANTSRLFIDGSKSIAGIYKDYVDSCKDKNVPFANYTLFYRVFTKEFNISFFVPKKDLCDTCVAFDNADDKENEDMKDKYDIHLIQKDLSRAEKKADKEKPNIIVAVYDLQAVMQLPKGDVSVFYYKSKLNVFNFTIYNLKENSCDCFVWDEGNGHRGVNELCSCILLYLRKISSTINDAEIIFYSDNCAGQQKNKFMLALYLYAVRNLGIKSITHKYLIKGHTQNEGDSAHSLIERQVKRQLKSGPKYSPDSFITAIRSAKKSGEPFREHELCYEDFYNIKALADYIGPLNMMNLKLAEVKVLKVVRELPAMVLYKNSYSEEFKEATVIKAKKKVKDTSMIRMTPAFYSKPGLSQKKKDDLLDLLNKKLIPKYYKTFYENL